MLVWWPWQIGKFAAILDFSHAINLNLFWWFWSVPKIEWFDWLAYNEVNNFDSSPSPPLLCSKPVECLLCMFILKEAWSDWLPNKEVNNFDIWGLPRAWTAWFDLANSPLKWTGLRDSADNRSAWSEGGLVKGASSWKLFDSPELLALIRRKLIEFQSLFSPTHPLISFTTEVAQ